MNDTKYNIELCNDIMNKKKNSVFKVVYKRKLSSNAMAHSKLCN